MFSLANGNNSNGKPYPSIRFRTADKKPLQTSQSYGTP